MPVWLQFDPTPMNVALLALIFCSLLLLGGVMAVWITLRRQTSQTRSMDDDLADLKLFLQEQQEASSRSLETTTSGIELLRKSLHEQSKLLESLRTSSKISEHWDALEKFIVFNEQLDRMSRDINIEFAALMDEVKSQQSERVRLAQNQFKTQIDQARKALEKAITGKLAGTMPRAQLDQVSATTIDSIRYSMLSVGKLHQDNLNGFARVLLEDVELKVQNGVRNTFYKIEDLKQKIEQFTDLLGTTSEPEPEPEHDPEAHGNGEATPLAPAAVQSAAVAVSGASDASDPSGVSPSEISDATPPAGDVLPVRAEQAVEPAAAEPDRVITPEFVAEPLRNGGTAEGERTAS